MSEVMNLQDAILKEVRREPGQSPEEIFSQARALVANFDK